MCHVCITFLSHCKLALIMKEYLFNIFSLICLILKAGVIGEPPTCHFSTDNLKVRTPKHLVAGGVVIWYCVGRVERSKNGCDTVQDRWTNNNNKTGWDNRDKTWVVMHVMTKFYESNLRGEDAGKRTAEGRSSRLRNRSASRSRLLRDMSAASKIRANGNYILECLLFQVRRFAFCAVFRKLKVAFFALLSWKSVKVTVTHGKTYHDVHSLPQTLYLQLIRLPFFL